MKKHIRKKFLFERVATEEDIEKMNTVATLYPLKEAQKIKPKKGDKGMFITDKNWLIQPFPFNNNGSHIWIPEPDPVLIYFDSAYMNYREIKTQKEKVFSILKDETLTEKIINDLYKLFSLTNGFVIFMFTAMEAFMNSLIPEHYFYSDIKNNRTEIYNKDQIQRHLSFDIKMKKVIVEITNKDFAKSYPMKFIHIQHLKEFRDAIVHTKTNTDGHTPYDYLYKKALNFKYEETINAVADFLNYYKSGYIEQCSCDKDF